MFGRTKPSGGGVKITDHFSVKNVSLTRGNIVQLFQKSARVCIDRLDDERIQMIKEHLIYEGICKRTVDWERKHQKVALTKRPREENKKKVKKFKRIRVNGWAKAHVSKDRKWKAEPETDAFWKDDAYQTNVLSSVSSILKRPHAVLEIKEEDKPKKLKPAANSTSLVSANHRRESSTKTKTISETLPLSDSSAEKNVAVMPSRDLIDPKRSQSLPSERPSLAVVQRLTTTTPRVSPVVEELRSGASLSQDSLQPRSSNLAVPPGTVAPQTMVPTAKISKTTEQQRIPVLPNNAGAPDTASLRNAVPTAVSMPKTGLLRAAAIPHFNVSVTTSSPNIPVVQTGVAILQTTESQRAANLPNIPVASLTSPSGGTVLPIHPKTVAAPLASLPSSSRAVATDTTDVAQPVAPVEQPILTDIKTEPGVVVEKRAAPSVPFVVIPVGSTIASSLTPGTITSKTVACVPNVVDSVGNGSSMQKDSPALPRVPMIRVRDPASLGIVVRRFSEENALKNPPTTTPTVVTAAGYSNGPQIVSNTTHCGTSRQPNAVSPNFSPNTTSRAPSEVTKPVHPTLESPTATSTAETTLLSLLESGKFNKEQLSTLLPTLSAYAVEIHRMSYFLSQLWDHLLLTTHNKDLIAEGHPLDVPSFAKECANLKKYINAKRPVFKDAMDKLAKRLTFERALRYIWARVRFLRYNKTGKDHSDSYAQLLQVFNLVYNNDQPRANGLSGVPATVPPLQLSRDNVHSVDAVLHNTSVTSAGSRGDVATGNSCYRATHSSQPTYQPGLLSTHPEISGTGLPSGYHIRVINSRLCRSDTTTTENGNAGHTNIPATITDGHSVPASTVAKPTNVYQAPSPATSSGTSVGRNLANFGYISGTNSSSQSNTVSRNWFPGHIPTTTASEKIVGADGSISIRNAISTPGYSAYQASNNNRNVGDTSVSGSQRIFVPNNGSSGNPSVINGRYPSNITCNSGYSSATTFNNGNPAHTTSNGGHSIQAPTAVTEYLRYSPSYCNGNIGNDSINALSNNLFSAIPSATSGVQYSSSITRGGVIETAIANGYPAYQTVNGNRQVGTASIGDKPCGPTTTVPSSRGCNGISQNQTGYARHVAVHAAANGSHSVPGANFPQRTGTSISFGNQESSEIRFNSSTVDEISSPANGKRHENVQLPNFYNASQPNSNSSASVPIQNSVIGPDKALRQVRPNATIASYKSLGNSIPVNATQSLVSASVPVCTSVVHPYISDKVPNHVSRPRVVPNPTVSNLRSAVNMIPHVKSSNASGINPYRIPSAATNIYHDIIVRTAPLVSKESHSNLASKDNLSPSLSTSNSDPLPDFQADNNGNQHTNTILNVTNVANGISTRTNPEPRSSASDVSLGSVNHPSPENFRASEALETLAKRKHQAEYPIEKHPTGNSDRQRPVLSQSQEMNVDKVAAASSEPADTPAQRKLHIANLLKQRIGDLPRKSEASWQVVIGKQGTSIVEMPKRTYRNSKKTDKRITASWMHPPKGAVSPRDNGGEVVPVQNVEKEVVSAGKNGKVAKSSLKDGSTTLPDVVQAAAAVTEKSRETVIRNNTKPKKSVPINLENCFECEKRAVGLCGACKIVAYCSNDCRITHWSRIHSKECQQK